MPRLLILGGTTEASALAAAAVDVPGLEVIVSLAGRTDAAPIPGQVRVGGFGGVAGLVEFLTSESITMVVDATHPFAARISAHAEQACTATGTPRLVLVRPMWPKVEGDHWIEVDTMAEAAQILPELGQSALLTIGRQELGAFAPVTGVRYVVRSLTAQPPPLANAQVVVGRPPFTIEDEIALLKTHAIQMVVTKAAGGRSTYSKIAAARACNLPVLMVRRPPAPAGLSVGNSAAALAWVTERAV
jgi:precorrin-6A/cobalt-precorrin-6A reductase